MRNELLSPPPTFCRIADKMRAERKIEADAAGSSDITIRGRCTFNADRQSRFAGQSADIVRLGYWTPQCLEIPQSI
jgi:hypothetical protein